MQNNKPLDKGRVAVIIEKYPTSQINQQTGQPIMGNRYANVGRATLWPAQQGLTMPNVEVEVDTMPVGCVAPVKFYIFWDSEKQNSQGYSQGQNQGYQR